MAGHTKTFFQLLSKPKKKMYHNFVPQIIVHYKTRNTLQIQTTKIQLTNNIMLYTYAKNFQKMNLSGCCA